MDELVGTQIGPYRLLARIAEGGMGVVYRAEDVNLGRPAAMKLMKPELAARRDLRERFRIEARGLSQLSHPSIAVLYDFYEDEDRLCLAMEYLDGGSLSDRLGGGVTLPVEEIVRVGAAVAEGLAHAHSRKMIHRDIKPENILFTTEGHPKITDFGLAKLVREVRPDLTESQAPTRAPSLTRPGTVLGTYHYMSPEQALARKLDFRCDIFSLGVVLFQMAAGRLPFTGDTAMDVLHALINDQPVPIRSTRQDFPVELQGAISRCLAKEPPARHPSMQALAEGLRRAGGQESAAPAPVFREETPPLSADGFVGREEELSSVLDLLRECAQGRGQTVFLAGEAGMGKSRFVEELGRRSAELGARLTSGRCLFRSGTRPYRPVIDAIRHHVEALGITEAEGLRAHVKAGNPQLLPRLGVIETLLGLPGAETGASAGPEELLDIVEAFLLGLTADGTVILHLDDLHWSHEATTRLLGHLALAAEKARLLIIGTYRPEDLGEYTAGRHPLHDLLDRLESSENVHRMELRRLGPREVGELVRARHPERIVDATFPRRLASLSAGNPLFVLEMLELLENTGQLRTRRSEPLDGALLEGISPPRRMRQLIERRLEPLEERDREVLEIAAVEGELFHSDTLESCLGMARLPLLRLLQSLQRRHRLVRSEGKAYRFHHATIREVLYDQLPPELRNEYHRAIGEHLATTRAEDPAEASAIAFHLLEAEEEVRALPFLVSAGSQAWKVYATDEALRFLDRAEGILGGPAAGAPDTELEAELRWTLGEVRALRGSFEEAIGDFRRFREIAEGAEDRRGVCRATERIGHVQFVLAEHREAADSARRALRIAEREGLTGEAANARTTLGNVLWAEGQVEESLQQHQSCLRIREELGDLPGTMDSLNRMANIHRLRAEYRPALECFERSLGLARERGDRRAEAFALNGGGGVLLAAGSASEAVGWFTEALRIREEIRDRPGASKTLNNLGLSYENLGEYDRALEFHDRSVRLKREMGDRNGIANSLTNIAIVQEHLGLYDDALEALSEGVAIKEELGWKLELPRFLTAVGRVHWKVHRTAEATASLQRALEIAREVGDAGEQVTALDLLAELHRGEGREEEAERLFAQAVEVARSSELKVEEFQTLYHDLRHRLRQRQGAGARPAVERLEILARDLSTDELAAKLDHMKGLWAATEGDLVGAVDELRKAARTAARLGMKELDLQVRYDLARLFERAEARQPAGHAGSALDEYRRAGEVLEEITRGIRNSETRQSFLESPVNRRILEKKSDS
jgi:tetratricopeptide (TPR) repeat protein